MAGPESTGREHVGAGIYGGSPSNNSVGVSAYWQPSESGFIPSISAGWGIMLTTSAPIGTSISRLKR